MPTSVISFKAVSDPSENSVPGTLLLIVAGITTIGMHSSLYLDLWSASWRTAWYACRNKNRNGI